MKTNIINDLQKYHRDAWLMIRQFHYDFVLKIIRENIIKGRKEGLYREDFDLDILSKLHLASAFILFDEQIFPDGSYSRDVLFREFMLHYLYGIVSPRGLTYIKKKIAWYVSHCIISDHRCFMAEYPFWPEFIVIVRGHRLCNG